MLFFFLIPDSLFTFYYWEGNAISKLGNIQENFVVWVSPKKCGDPHNPRNLQKKVGDFEEENFLQQMFEKPLFFARNLTFLQKLTGCPRHPVIPPQKLLWAYFWGSSHIFSAGGHGCLFGFLGCEFMSSCPSN